MKLLPLLFASLLLFVPSSQQDAPELKEAADLTESVVKLIAEKRYSDAVCPAKRAFEIREKLLPRDDSRIGNSLIYLVDIYTARRDFGKAKEMLLRLLQHQTERFGAEHIKLVPTLERLGVHHRDHRLSGRVIVRVMIDETGKVISAEDLCGGPPYLSEASVKSAYGARFSPTIVSGKPIQVTGVIQYNFVNRSSR